MDPSAIKTGTPPATAIQSGLPETNGTATEAPQPSVKRQPKTLPVQVLHLLADLRITVVLFSLSMLLVFWGTLAQVDFGVWTVVAKYFRSFFVWIPLKVVLFNGVEITDRYIPFPGGWLLGSVMLINLLAAHAIRFKFTWARSGILLIHSGLIVIMLGEVVTGTMAIEGQMPIKIGETVNYVTHPGTAEFVVIRHLNPKDDEVVSAPRARLQEGATIEDAKLPFKVKVLEYMINSDIEAIEPDKVERDARGHARQNVAIRLPEVAGVEANRHDAPSMYVRLIALDGADMGKWLFSVLMQQQWITIDGKEYQVSLRFQQTKREFNFHLTDFKHEVFAGTSKPKDFRSFIHLTDKEYNVDRNVQIYMNAPLYYRGETFYQSSWLTDPLTRKANGTVLQVVHNPGWLMPYLACLLVGVGMLIHFGLTLYKFVDRRVVR